VETIEQKEQQVKDKVVKAKKKIVKKVTPSDEKPKKKPVKPLDIEQYISQKETTTSSARLTCWMMYSSPNGCHIDTLSQRALELGSWKESKWGTKANIRSHISYLKSRGVEIQEVKEDVFKIVV